MSINDPASYNHKFCHVNGIRLHYVDENAESSKALLLLHGWPDLWFGWREQIRFLTGLGYRVIVPTLRGFGDTDAPTDPDAYSPKAVSTDLKELLDHLQIPTVTVIGHDWGGFLAWRFTQYFPERVVAVASFCTPYSPPHNVYMTVEQIAKVQPSFGYQVYFAGPNAKDDMDSDPEQMFTIIFRPHKEAVPLIDRQLGTTVRGRPKMKKSDAVPQIVLDYYANMWKKTGAQGGLLWYHRTMKGFNDQKDLDPIIRKPALMVTAENDVALPPSMTSKMNQYIPDLTIQHVKDTGHWILWEQPEICNSILKDWLKKTYPVKL